MNIDNLKEQFNKLKRVYCSEIKMKVGDIVVTILSVGFGGLLIGWMVLGWWVFPVEWEYPEPQVIVETQTVQSHNLNGISYQSKLAYVRLLSEWNALLPDNPYLPLYLSEMDDIDVVACDLMNTSVDIGEQQRYVTIAYKANGYGCE